MSVVSLVICSHKSFSPFLSVHQTKYTVVFDYSGACKDGGGGGGGRGGDKGPTATLGVGSILLIL